MKRPASGPPEVNIFTRMSELARRYDAVNLGQGFPDDSGPAHIIEAASAAMREGRNQYPPVPGVPELREAVARHQRTWYGLEPRPDGGVLVTTGASEALAAAILAFVGPGDEVVVLEPFYDSYRSCVELAGGVLVPVRLRAPGHRLDEAALAAAIGERTRVLLLNSPHNPTGTVLDEAELRAVAALAKAHDLLVISDEVYEHLVYDGGRHLPIAALPGMWDRVVSVGSAGKTFSLTGWKIGWATGPVELIERVQAVKQYLSFAAGTPFQYGIARALESGPDYYRRLLADYRLRRDRIVAGLRDIGFTVHRPQGSYFVTAGIEPFGGGDGMEFCLRMAEQCGVVAIPNQVFYADPDGGRTAIRFAFCKPVAVIEEGLRRLRRGLKPADAPLQSRTIIDQERP
ncbi:MAG TPA: aminotransferase class I/II-fold pyridoxal phosphate-dependent enzyme [Glycomyces sp.]|nr:aminotransferase class I/II-fold pyridoxal phosphate-dependent enzyme [Glycomyces sp.]